MIDIEIKNNKNLIPRLINAIYNNYNVVYKGKYIINNIGDTTYIDFDFLRCLSIDGIEDLISKI